MQIRQLQYFVAVAENLSFRKAAESLYVTQPLLSKQIAALEDEVGFPLLVRDTRSVSLTTAGEIMLQEANNLLRQCDSLVANVRSAAKSEKIQGQLRIGYEDGFDRLVISNSINSLLENNKDIVVSISRLDDKRIEKQLSRGEIDLGLVLFPQREPADRLNFRLLYGDSLSLCASSTQISKGNRLEEYISLANTKRVCMLEKNSKWMKLTSKLLHQLNISAEISYVATMQEMIIFAESGMGVSVCPRCLTDSFHSPLLVQYDLGIPEARLCMAAIWPVNSICPTRDAFLKEFSRLERRCNDCNLIGCWGKTALQKF